jgi:hypothetical protein
MPVLLSRKPFSFDHHWLTREAILETGHLMLGEPGDCSGANRLALAWLNDTRGLR